MAIRVVGLEICKPRLRVYPVGIATERRKRVVDDWL